MQLIMKDKFDEEKIHRKVIDILDRHFHQWNYRKPWKRAMFTHKNSWKICDLQAKPNRLTSKSFADELTRAL